MRIDDCPTGLETSSGHGAASEKTWVRLQEEDLERETDGLEDYYEEEDIEDKPEAEI